MWGVLNVDTGELLTAWKNSKQEEAERMAALLNKLRYYNRVYAAVKVNEDGSLCRYNATTEQDISAYCNRPVFR